MKLTVNGEDMETTGAVRVADVLRMINAGASRVVVFVNGTPVKTGERESHALKNGDSVEVLTLAGGG